MTKYSGIRQTLITDRLNLEPLTPDDHAFMESLVNSKGWLENIGDRNVHSKNDAIIYVNKILGTEHLFYWVVHLKDANTPIGIISFQKRDYLENFDIGFAFLPFFIGKGYAYEAASAVLMMVSRLPEIDKVLATTRDSNKNSIRLLKKLGFSFEKEIQKEDLKLQIYSLDRGG